MKNAKKCGNAQKILKSIVYSYGIEYKSKICEMRGYLKQKKSQKTRYLLQCTNGGTILKLTVKQTTKFFKG